MQHSPARVPLIIDMYKFTAPFQAPSGSPIRELFKYLNKPGMISFAGGYPASDLFDVEGLQSAAVRAYQASDRCLQYGPTDGLPELKKEVLGLMTHRGVHCGLDEMLVTTGSQQGLDLLLRVFVGPGDVVLTEQPAYPATLQALTLQRAKIVTVPVDAEGLDVTKLSELLDSGAVAQPKFLYTVPTFANPTGATLTRERRLSLLRLAVKYKFLIVEDDPYSELRFSGVPTPSLLSLTSDVHGSRDWVVYFGSLSKIAAPGMRIGWLIGPSEIVRRCVVAKQTADLCSSPWTQAIAAEYLADGALHRHLPKISATYRLKCDVLCAELRSQFGTSIEFHQPDGGMFVWARLPGADTTEVLKHAISNKAIFVPGNAFFFEKSDPTSLRLSFAAPNVEEIAEGVRRLRQACDGMHNRFAQVEDSL